MILIDGSEPVFVGEVAHVVGAVQSGPRGDVEVEDRDAFANLLVLRHRHHVIIDNEYYELGSDIDKIRSSSSLPELIRDCPRHPHQQA